MNPFAPVSRRAALRGLAAVALTGVARARAKDLDLVYAKGQLSWPGGSTRAAIGKAGVRREKREGDLATPEGEFPLLQGFYRPDRIAAPKTALPMRPLHPEDAWVDDPADANYNSFVHLPYHAHVERLWRKDDIYDLLVVIGYNSAPRRPGAGSAIFLHIARKSYSPTVGCVAIDRTALIRLLPQLGPESRIRIEA